VRCINWSGCSESLIPSSRRRTGVHRNPSLQSILALSLAFAAGRRGRTNRDAGARLWRFRPWSPITNDSALDTAWPALVRRAPGRPTTAPRRCFASSWPAAAGLRPHLLRTHSGRSSPRRRPRRRAELTRRAPQAPRLLRPGLPALWPCHINAGPPSASAQHVAPSSGGDFAGLRDVQPGSHPAGSGDPNRAWRIPAEEPRVIPCHSLRELSLLPDEVPSTPTPRLPRRLSAGRLSTGPAGCASRSRSCLVSGRGRIDLALESPLTRQANPGLAKMEGSLRPGSSRPCSAARRAIRPKPAFSTTQCPNVPTRLPSTGFVRAAPSCRVEALRLRTQRIRRLNPQKSRKFARAKAGPVLSPLDPPATCRPYVR